ncbi:ribbon-helix-helix domain-containing protein [Stygiolobus caldivivus]|uniref:Predicted DNA-binding protein ribbon-helix-helix domain-containing protein n=1 Tax=Stygiolobus caldivivus TaxID=2824673 RepID=A0A8D5U6R0_9CREN|nr:ribbon-helix-helix domain-containing protein [Stygiolobus caldivivus]BCU70339.1 hypothetical protein KN1_16360 [Stygiolobus caldivivus]
MNVKIPEEWYEILVRLSKQKRIPFSKLLDDAISSGECLNLPDIPTSGKIKTVNLKNIKENEKDILVKIRRFLFCN